MFILRVLHADIHKVDNSIQWCTYHGHPEENPIYSVCFSLSETVFHPVHFYQNQIPVFDYSIRFANFVPCPQYISRIHFASHSICDFIMIRFTLYCSSMCNPLLRSSGWPGSSNLRPSRLLSIPLVSYPASLCKML